MRSGKVENLLQVDLWAGRAPGGDGRIPSFLVIKVNLTLKFDNLPGYDDRVNLVVKVWTFLGQINPGCEVRKLY